MLNVHKPDFVFISKPWIPIDCLPAGLWRKIHLKLVVNSKGSLIPNLCCAYVEHLELKVIDVPENNRFFSQFY